MDSQKVLLLNASNMETFPVFPYAFIQVPAVAKQADIDVICQDMLGISQEMWMETVQALIERHNPTMILVTLRNTDSLNSQDYEKDRSKEVNRSAYFPIEQTEGLIAAIREVSDLKITVGGFGFSVLPNEIMHYLRPDFGVFGGSDAFFAHFEDIQREILGDVANLLFFKDGQLISNPRVFYPPFVDNEYTPQVIEEMMAFYDAFPSPGFQGAPVEIMRGCNHSCVFCSEPLVKGTQVRYRDLSVVMHDIKMLVEHGITRIYIVSSELNPEGNAFVLQLADSILSFNKRQPEDRMVSWFGANYLLKFEIDEYERLYKSGFTGGWFDITALDDENARAMRTPYRNESLLAHLKTYAQHERAQNKRLQTHKASQTELNESEDNANQKDGAIKWSQFLGNPATTTRTIRNTLRIAHEEGLDQLFSNCGINTHMRVFDYEKLDKGTLDVTYSVTPDLTRTDYQQLLPSFVYPPALLHKFGSEEEISRMSKHLAETYLSTNYQKSRDWHSFVKHNTTPESITSWMAELSKLKNVKMPDLIRPTTKGKASAALQRLYSEETLNEEKSNYEDLSKQVVDSLLSVCLEAFHDLFGSLDLPLAMDKLERITPYELAVAIFKRWRSEKELYDELTEQIKLTLSDSMQDFIRFCILAMLYRFNIILTPKYRGLFISAEMKGTTRYPNS